MSYHNIPASARQSTTNTQGQTAPTGFHYMPDGTLMSDIEHARLYGIKLITGFNLDFNDIKAAGESRLFTITGSDGAKFSLEIKNEDNYYYNFQTNLFQAAKTRLNNETIANGTFKGNIKFPLVTDADQYDVYLWAEENTEHIEYNKVVFADNTIDINSSTGSSSNLLQKVIYQTLDVTVTLKSFSPNGTVTGTIGAQTFTASRNKSAPKIPISFIFTATATKALTINKQPGSDDVLTFVEAVTTYPVDIPGENIYPSVRPAFTGDDINGAITSGAVVRMDNTDLSAVIAVADKITTPVMTDTVNCSDCSSATAIIMDAAVATKMAVGDQVIGNAVLNAALITVAAINVGGDANTFSLSSAVAIADGTTLSFSSKINRSVTTVTVVETSSTATDFTMSQDIQFRDNAPLTFSPRRNYRWSINNIDKLKDGMMVLADATSNGFTGNVQIGEYLDQITILPGGKDERKITNVRIPALDNLSVKPTIARNASTKVVTTTQTGNITFNQQAFYSFVDNTTKIFSYGPEEINRLTDYDVEFSDLAIALTAVTTTTTTAPNAATTFNVTSAAGIADDISTVSGIGIDPAVVDPTVTAITDLAGGTYATGSDDYPAAILTVGAAQTLENGITLTFPGAGSIATITGYIKVNNVGNTNVDLMFDLEKLLTMH